jgi:hypothetical protein
MKGVELYGRVRHAVQIEGLSRCEAARRFRIDPRDEFETRKLRSRRFSFWGLAFSVLPEVSYRHDR